MATAEEWFENENSHDAYNLGDRRSRTYQQAAIWLQHVRRNSSVDRTQCRQKESGTALGRCPAGKGSIRFWERKNDFRGLVSYADRVCGAVVLGGLLESIVFRSSPPLVRSSGFCSAKLYLQCPCHRRLLSCVRCFKAFQRKDLKQLEDGLVQFVVAGLLDLRAGAAGAVSYTHLTLPTTPYV